jgi:hypothetical protein
MKKQLFRYIPAAEESKERDGYNNNKWIFVYMYEREREIPPM